MVERSYYLIVENIKEAKNIELKILSSKDNYVISNKFSLKDNLPNKIYNYLVKQGLFKDIKTGQNKYDSKFGLHRLCTCLYENTLGVIVHHIDRHKDCNNIMNLLPVDNEETHTILDHYDPDGSLARKLQNNFKSKIFKPKRKTLASSDEIILGVLKLKEQGFSIEKIIEKLDNKSQKSSVYNNLNEFYYRKEFLEYLENGDTKDFSEFNGKIRERWTKIIDFNAHDS